MRHRRWRRSIEAVKLETDSVTHTRVVGACSHPNLKGKNFLVTTCVGGLVQ